MPTRPLPSDPSFDNLKNQAKRLHKAVHAGDVESVALVQELHPHSNKALGKFLLADAQLVIARSYRFASWAKLKQHLAMVQFPLGSAFRSEGTGRVDGRAVFATGLLDLWQLESFDGGGGSSHARRTPRIGER